MVEIKLEDYETIILIVDDIRYEIDKKNIGFSILREDKYITVDGKIKDEVIIDGE